MNKVITAFRATPEERNYLALLARIRGVTVSDVLRQAVRQEAEREAARQHGGPGG